MNIDILTLFPEMFEGILDTSIIKRGQDKKIIDIKVHNLRKWGDGERRNVDDRPYGGGVGMVLRVDIIDAALKDIKKKGSKVILLDATGEKFVQKKAQKLSKENHLILVAGHYEGVDERLLEAEVDEELSIGDYVLSGGELAAMVVIDAITRQLPGALGHELSAQEDSFADGLLDCPHYTRPEVYQGRQVPEVLLSGNHEEIRRWRLKQALGRTRERRPDLLEGRALTPEEEQLLAEYLRQRDTSTDNQL